MSRQNSDQITREETKREESDRVTRNNNNQLSLYIQMYMVRGENVDMDEAAVGNADDNDKAARTKRFGSLFD